jgi:hypothetical protein
MRELLHFAVRVIPWILGLYGIAFLSGGVYYMEQRVARIRDQFPRHAPLARLHGALALSIGVLALVSAVGYLASGQSESRLGALVAVVAGVGFWLHRLRTALTLGSQIRAGLFAAVCAVLAALTAHWMQA